MSAYVPEGSSRSAREIRWVRVKIWEFEASRCHFQKKVILRVDETVACAGTILEGEMSATGGTALRFESIITQFLAKCNEETLSVLYLYGCVNFRV